MTSHSTSDGPHQSTTEANDEAPQAAAERDRLECAVRAAGDA